MVLIDMQKTFDTVDHLILCKKLSAMGIASIGWFHSYLSNRKQMVSVNGANSSYRNITCGVPQGSILGPLLYLCYVNDIQISVNCKLLLYADDTALIVSGKDPNVISNQLGIELSKCNSWLVDNKLSMHLGKTECILFGSQRKLKKVHSFNISCDGHTIKGSDCVKYLGSMLDQCLSGDAMSSNVLKKAGSRLKFLYRHALFLNTKSRKTLCSALIQPYFDYLCTT